MTDGEAGFLAALFERHGRVVYEEKRVGKRAYPYFSVVLFRVPKHLAAWLLERVPGTKMSGSFVPYCTIKFVTPEDACRALVHAYDLLLSLKCPAQIYFRYAKIVGRQGKRLSKKQFAERQALAKELAACRQEE